MDRRAGGCRCESRDGRGRGRCNSVGNARKVGHGMVMPACLVIVLVAIDLPSISSQGHSLGSTQCAWYRV